MCCLCEQLLLCSAPTVICWKKSNVFGLILQNSVSYHGTDLQSIIDELNKKISHEASEVENRITGSDVTTAVARLKSHKTDGGTDLTSDHLKPAGIDLFGHIALLFNSILIHGTLLANFVHSTIILRPKCECHR